MKALKMKTMIIAMFNIDIDIYVTRSTFSFIKGRTIRKLMGGRGGRSTKKIFAQGKIKRKKIHAAN